MTAIEGISRKIGEMDEISTVIASAIEEQGAATGEISNNSQQASQNIAGVNQAAMETGSAAAQVLNSAADLAKQSDARSEVQKFLTEVRAA